MTRPRARRWYRLLLRLLPRDVRRRFGPDMEQLFVDRLSDVDGRPVERARLWVDGVLDVVGVALKERAGATASAIRSIMVEGTRMEGWIQDLRFGVRSLARHRGFALAALLTLALGIGANAAIFSVVNGVLLSPLPFPEADRLVTVWTADRRTGSRDESHDHPDVTRWREEVAGFDVVGIAGASKTLTGLGDPEVIPGRAVTGGLLTLMGADPVLGRDLTPEDDVPDGPRVVVVSHRLWSERLGRDPEALAGSLTLNGEPWTIVGVGPQGFDYPNGTDYWVPQRHDSDGCAHGCRFMVALGRVDSSTTFEAVQARLDAISGSLAADFPDEHRDDLTRIEPLLDTQVADVRSALWVLLGAVGMVLLIACANVANLLLVRAADRVGEVALRATIGASRARLVRQFLAESLLIASLAGVLGVGLAMWGTDTLVAMAPESLPRLAEVGIDGRVLLFSGLLVVGVTVLFGVLPALQTSSSALTEGLASGRRAVGGRRAGLSRSLLLAGEVALSLSLLLGAGVLFRTLGEMRSVDFGFATTGVERFRINTPDSRYDTEATIRFQRALEEALLRVPGVESAGMAFGAPLASGNIGTSLRLLDRPEVDPADQPSFAIRPATPGYLEASGMTLLRGRWFTDEDRRDNVGVAVISETGARLHYPGSDPMGKRVRASLSWGFDDDPERTIVGVVKDVRAYGATEEPRPALYFPNAQFGVNSIYVAMRLAEGVPTVMPEVRRVLRDMDPDLAITRVARIEESVAQDQAATRFYLTLISVFSVLALVLAAVGLYGVLSYAASQRTREIGIRMALGARSDNVTGMVLRQGIRPALAGILLGYLTWWVGSRALESLLFGVEPTDPATIATATVMLGVVVLAATLLPALRASRVPPATALRYD